MSLLEVKKEQEESSGGEKQSWVKFCQTKVNYWIVSAVVKYLIQGFEGYLEVNWNFFYSQDKHGQPNQAKRALKKWIEIKSLLFCHQVSGTQESRLDSLWLPQTMECGCPRGLRTWVQDIGVKGVFWPGENYGAKSSKTKNKQLVLVSAAHILKLEQFRGA